MTSTKTKATSLERFKAALVEVTPNPEVAVTVEELTLTATDPNSTVYNYRNQRTGTIQVPAVLYTVKCPRPGTSNGYTLQALFATDGGHFVSADDHGITSAERIEEQSRWRTSQPFGWKGVSLTDALVHLNQMKPEVLAAEKAKIERDKQKYEEILQQRAQEHYEEQSRYIGQAREKAIAALGEAATVWVLDYFLPLPVDPSSVSQ